MRQGNVESRIPSFRSGIGLLSSGTRCTIAVPRDKLGFVRRQEKKKKMENMEKPGQEKSKGVCAEFGVHLSRKLTKKQSHYHTLSCLTCLGMDHNYGTSGSRLLQTVLDYYQSNGYGTSRMIAMVMKRLLWLYCRKHTTSVIPTTPYHSLTWPSTCSNGQPLTPNSVKRRQTTVFAAHLAIQSKRPVGPDAPPPLKERVISWGNEPRRNVCGHFWRRRFSPRRLKSPFISALSYSPIFAATVCTECTFTEYFSEYNTSVWIRYLTSATLP